MSPDVPGILPQLLNRGSKIYAAHAYDGEDVKPNRIYISRPDHHLLIRSGKVRTTHGPKENRFRPAIDPLFRSAAYAYTDRVIGVILSGALDDGTAGLWTVKHYGGIAIVQDPSDAEVSAMPESAMRQVNVDHCVPVSEIAELLVRLCKEPVTEKPDIMKDEQTRKEIEIAAEENALEKGLMDFGELSPFTCPECHGVLSRLYNGDLVRYRCHTGHSYTVDALMASLTEKVEDYLYNAIRGMDETIILLNHLGDHYAESNQPQLAALFFKKSKQAGDRSQLVRKAVMTHEQLSKESMEREVQSENVTVEK
jgi:two-component system chemotaxis response regulator CheB